MVFLKGISSAMRGAPGASCGPWRLANHLNHRTMAVNRRRWRGVLHRLQCRQGAAAALPCRAGDLRRTGPPLHAARAGGKRPTRATREDHMQIGFIGLGMMGASMASNLQAAGYKVTVHDARREAATGHIKAGAQWADTPKALAA